MKDVALGALAGIGIGVGLTFCWWMASSYVWLKSIARSLIRMEHRR